MKLSGQTVTVVLAEQGNQVLRLAGVETPDFPLFTAFVEESEDLGMWIRIPKRDQVRIFLLRWEYILGIDFDTGKSRLIGIRG